MTSSPQPGFLVLEDPQNPDGLAYPGFLFGAEASAESILRNPDRGYGESVFNTSLTGYQEILTDPSYYGQIVAMTCPHIGNTGVNLEDPESPHPWCAGFVVNELSDEPSNWRAQSTLDSYLKKNGIPGIQGVDTRALTRHLRALGVVRAMILPAADRARFRELLPKMPAFEGRDLIREVTTREAYLFSNKGPAQGSVEAQLPTSADQAPAVNGRGLKVVALDFGAKWNLLRSIERFGCEIEVVPANTSAQAILARKPDGIFLSNGPGDPSAAPYAAETVRSLVGIKPIFGVCMGHQILALSMGAKTYKLKFGHRGGNQPVLEKSSGKVAITSQNHGYAVDQNNLPAQVEVTHIHLNDRTVAGLKVTTSGSPAFSVQYHPEACPGPHDSAELFQRFVKSMLEAKRE
jgi:carbamoyl-phosphate synthase small subunit